MTGVNGPLFRGKAFGAGSNVSEAAFAIWLYPEYDGSRDDCGYILVFPQRLGVCRPLERGQYKPLKYLDSPCRAATHAKSNQFEVTLLSR